MEISTSERQGGFSIALQPCPISEQNLPPRSDRSANVFLKSSKTRDTIAHAAHSAAWQAKGVATLAQTQSEYLSIGGRTAKKNALSANNIGFYLEKLQSWFTKRHFLVFR